MIESSNNLKHLKVEGFKSISKFDQPMGDINIFIGANGAGKSNLISIFTFLGNLSQGKLSNYVETEGGAERFFHFGSKHTSQIMFDLEVGMNGYHVEFSHSPFDDSLVFDKETCTIETSSKLWPLSPVNGESGFRSFDGQYVIKYTKQYLDACRVYHFHDSSSQAKFKKTNKLVNNLYLERDAANIASFLYRLKNSKTDKFQQSYQQIVTVIQSVAPFFHDFSLEPTGEEGDENILLRWIHTKHENPFSANILSDGTARFICLATLFLQPETLRPNTIILDEAELGLHPAALSILADIIKSVSKETQVICSTQSVTFANSFEPEDFIVADAKDGVSHFHRPETDELKQWLEDYGMGDIWAKNLIGGRPQW